jgi:hypothetical protein
VTILTNDVRTGPELAVVEADDLRTACPFEAVHDVEGRAALLEVIQEMETQVATLREALQSNRRIGIAVGIVMVRLAVDAEAAFDAIRQISMNSNRKLHDVAEDVIREGVLEGAVSSRAGRQASGPPLRPA